MSFDPFIDIDVQTPSNYLEKLKKYVLLGNDINNQDSKGNTILHLCCMYGSRFEPIVNFLIESGSNINIQNNIGNAPLHLTCSSGWKSISKKLIEHNASLNCVNKNHETPLLLACAYQFENLVNLLIESGADVNIPNQYNVYPLHLICTSGNKNIFNNLIKHHKNINCFNKDNETPIYLACLYNQYDIASSLIELGVDVNLTTTIDRSPLYNSICRNFKDMTKLLIDSGASLNIISSQGYTCAQIFILYFQEEDFSILLSKEIDFSVKNHKKNNLFHIAAINGFVSVIQKGIQNPIFHKDLFELNDKAESPLDLAKINNHEIIISLIHSFQEYLELKNSTLTLKKPLSKKIKI